MSQPEVYVVIAANRGIGLAITAKLASIHPSAIIYGTARILEGAKELHELAAKHSNVRPIAADASNADSIKRAAALIAKEFGYVDVLIHNAGISGVYSSIKEMDLDGATHVWRINTLGPILVYQAFHDLLLKSRTKKFAVISSEAGSIGGYLPLPTAGYGASKAALNHMIRAIAAETKDEGLIVTAIHPGLVTSDMGLDALKTLEGSGADTSQVFTLTPDESAEAVVAVIEKNSETDKFLNYTGDEVPW